jgi:FlaA1/EpsC-like NDP-sugar epimerase
MGYPVFGGKDSLKEIVDRYGVSEVVISFRNMDKDSMNSLRKECSTLGVNLSCLRILIG